MNAGHLRDLGPALRELDAVDYNEHLGNYRGWRAIRQRELRSARQNPQLAEDWHGRRKLACDCRQWRGQCGTWDRCWRAHAGP
jgi:hypothetical protein